MDDRIRVPTDGSGRSRAGLRHAAYSLISAPTRALQGRSVPVSGTPRLGGCLHGRGDVAAFALRSQGHDRADIADTA